MQKGIVLIVEDDTDMRDLLVEFLCDDFVTVAVGSAEEGLRMAQQVHPMLIVCDMNMPAKTGLHTIRGIRSDPQLQHLPVILISGQEEPVEACQYNVRFLPKPFDITTLMRVVDSVLPGTPTSQAA